jgi:hypothetical protein
MTYIAKEIAVLLSNTYLNLSAMSEGTFPEVGSHLWNSVDIAVPRGLPGKKLVIFSSPIFNFL